VGAGGAALGKTDGLSGQGNLKRGGDLRNSSFLKKSGGKWTKSTIPGVRVKTGAIVVGWKGGHKKAKEKGAGLTSKSQGCREGGSRGATASYEQRD